MPSPTDTIEFSLSVIAAVVFFYLAGCGLLRGRIYSGGKRPSIDFRLQRGAFLGRLLLYAGVACICGREALQMATLFIKL